MLLIPILIFIFETKNITTDLMPRVMPNNITTTVGFGSIRFFCICSPLCFVAELIYSALAESSIRCSSRYNSFPLNTHSRFPGMQWKTAECLFVFYISPSNVIDALISSLQSISQLSVGVHIFYWFKAIVTPKNKIMSFTWLQKFQKCWLYKRVSNWCNISMSEC